MVVCPGCGKENGASFRFCMGCGAAMPKRSPGGTLNPPAAGFEETAPLGLPAVIPELGPVTWTATAKPSAPPSALELHSIAIDGSATGSHRLNEGTTVFGRERGGGFARDKYLSPSHGSFTPRGERLLVRDEHSLNGVYRKLRAGEPCLLAFGQWFRVGQELLRFEALTSRGPDPHGVERLGASPEGYLGRIVLVLGRGSTGNAYLVPKAGLQIGRERGEVTFPNDGYVSGAHCRIAQEAGHVVLVDLGSSNGTFVKLQGETEVGPGEVLLFGQQLFRVALASR